MAAQKAFDTFQICVGNAVRAPQLMKRGRAAISCSCKACAFASMSATGNSARMTATAASFTLRALTLCALTLCSLLERDSSRSRCLQVVPPSYEIRFNAAETPTLSFSAIAARRAPSLLRVSARCASASLTFATQAYTVSSACVKALATRAACSSAAQCWVIAACNAVRASLLGNVASFAPPSRSSWE